jgi:acyl-CoA thioester hydrolase
VTTPSWSAPVRFAEVDQQGVVFNAHYLTYCDEALGAFFGQQSTEQLDLRPFSAGLKLVNSTLTWVRAAAYGEVVDVAVSCERVGTTSMAISFEVQADGHDCCHVHTVYVNVDQTGKPAPIPDEVRAVVRPNV